MLNLKEFYMDPISGKVDLEYDDNSTKSFTMDTVASLVSGAGIVAKKRRAAILHAGDSITGYADAYQEITRTSSDTPYGNGAFSIASMSWANGTASAGTLTFVKAAQTLTWTPPGDAVGAPVDVSRAGVYTIAGADATKTITVVCRPRAYSGSTEGAFSVTTMAGTEVSRRSGKAPPNWMHAKACAGYDRTILANGGSRISDIAESLNWQVTAGVYDVIHLHAGTNDVAQDRTLAQMQTDMTALITAARALAPQVLVDTINPRSLSMTTTRRQVLHGFNTWLLSLRLPGVRVSNTFAAIVDPDSATGDPASTMLEDGLHSAMRGSEAMGEVGYLDLADLLSFDTYQGMSSQADTYDATNNPYGNQLTGGGTFTGTTGNVVGAGMSGTLADNWIVARESGADITVVCSKVARSDGRPGNMQRLTIANAGATAQTIILQQLNVARPTAAAGQTWKAQGALTASNLVGCEYISVAIIPDSPGSGRMEAQWGTGTVAGSFLSGTKRKIVGEPYELVVPAGATKLQLALRVRLAATTGAAVIDLWPGEWKLWRTS